MSAAGLEVRRPWSGGGGSVLKNTEGGWLMSEGGGCGSGGRVVRELMKAMEK